MSTAPTLSVVIPAFNRIEPLKFTLRSLAQAAGRFAGIVETLLVDDGSTPPLEQQLRGFDAGGPITFLRQSNQGSIAARLHGLRSARGDFVLFLDSDDLVHPDKFQQQVEAMRLGAADVSYSDMAEATLGANYSVENYIAGSLLPTTAETAELFLAIQPVPHAPIYRRDYLLAALAELIVPVERAMDPVGDVWLYYNLSIHPARIVKVAAPLTAIGPHEENRYSRHWEKLGIAALRVAEAFITRCPATEDTRKARTQAGECAFHSWRKLPRNFNHDYEERTLTIWRRAPHGPAQRLGGPLFQTLARILGAELAGRVLRRRNHSYESCRTIDETEYTRLFAPDKFQS